MYWITQWFYPSLQTTQSLGHSVGFNYYIISRHKLLQVNILKSIFRLTLCVLQILLLHNTHMCWISTIYHRGYGMAYQWSQCQGQVSLMYRVMHNHRITMAVKFGGVIPVKETGFPYIIKPISLKPDQGGYSIVLNRRRQQRKTWRLFVWSCGCAVLG